ncbi:MAG TPA: hypothetical protein VJC39_03500 [Candidatus Nanoarchaeia archaeon]|nr:hypothetical protein [Candidatus Nanoarchaeia archaeon]
MAEESGFRAVIGLLDKIGVYDIILPFLLVFTIVFAILEKTKILGIEKVGGQELTKKNINAMVALVMAFLVIASTQLVAVISEVMANVVLLLILSVCFLLLVGSFFGDKEFSLKDYGPWIKFFMIFMFMGIVIIFLNALDWLKFVVGLFVLWPADLAVGILFGLVVIGFIWFIVKSPKEAKKEKKD